MSLKAGGVGINLTAASNAFVLVCLKESNHIADCFLIHALYLKVLLGQSCEQSEGCLDHLMC